MTDLANHLTKTQRDQSFPNLRPRDAATIILIDRSGPESKVLMGRRHHGHKFMPGKFAFPGGRFDPRCFAADPGAIADRVEGLIGADAGLVELVWVPIAAAKELDLPTITHVVLVDLEARIAAGFGHELPVPYYRMVNRRFVREL